MDTAIHFWNNIIANCGDSRIIISDGYPKYTSEFWNNLYEMLGTKLAFLTTCHPQTDGLEDMMTQTLEYIIRRFCAYGIQYKDNEGSTHYWLILLPAVQLAYNPSVHSVAGKTPSILEKGWNLLLPVDYLKEILLPLSPTAKDFKTMWRTKFYISEKCIVEAKLYNKQRYCKIYQ
ncbi:hypothetical protein O181_002988 [Austropuccinia psidii MF-1]|uniref:Integrase catalytic domain-containing protein n=1 Tax=Austropuccinia psidii MF-1 TaxID=1389203 RepID=A0A9Q3BDS7_9BASI|nr:hypothetical protein [Austropuccinia psidii MF-1]